MYRIAKILLTILRSKLSIYVIGLFILGSLIASKISGDMNLFAASGAVLTIFGLFQTIQFTTIEKFLNQDAIVHSSTGVTGPPLSVEESERIINENRKKAKIKLEKELKSEIKGISYTIIGTLIWAYGIYLPI
ncbi:hypothetical protein NDS20_003597 [Acinetobacter baumannii]|jgi:hypothetical protein|uniref:DUF3899 domain-containing protein n=8 Tax=Acinetobacter calcoaceticus/baumannii complex TaxID=909768 RepID=A0A290UJF8_ACIBA|nr:MULTISPECIES: hypothetical protein [Acinetobacter]SSW81848.1 Uncharacterised protein [Klebsiella pneumoniae]ATD22245.1 hypothetical protein BS098_19965 [Acinetobacter baumannii]AVO89384.1 hypothetical protein AM480_00060 [Acinetobacter baumannii]AXG87053.1 hypothetical protein Aba810CP_19940 [Acinetobacter baumannii]AZB91689.1 hypothetical protein DKE41_019100 [Acinetobacter pittii]